MRRVLTIAALVLAILAGGNVAALADAPKVLLAGPRKVEAGGTVVISAIGSVSDNPLDWELEDSGEDRPPFVLLDSDGQKGVVLLMLAAQPGTYRFNVVASGIPKGSDKLRFKFRTFQVEVGDAKPAPPVVTPDPIPIPGPVVPPPRPEPAAGTPEAIGRAYGKELAKAASSALVVAADGTAATPQDLIGASASAFGENLKRAASVLEADMVRRFGSATANDASRLPEIKLYLKGVSAGVTGGVN